MCILVKGHALCGMARVQRKLITCGSVYSFICQIATIHVTATKIFNVHQMNKRAFFAPLYSNKGYCVTALPFQTNGPRGASIVCWVCWGKLVIPVFKRPKEEGWKFDASLGHVGRPCPAEGDGTNEQHEAQVFALGSRESQFLGCRPVLVAFVGWFHGYWCVVDFTGILPNGYLGPLGRKRWGRG